MPRPTVTELNEARRRSGNLGGRPRKPTVSEAREKALAELVPKAVRAFDKNLDSDKESVRQRAAEYVYDQERGKAVQRVEATVRAEAPWETWTQEQRAYVLAQLEARRALPAREIGCTDGS